MGYECNKKRKIWVLTGLIVGLILVCTLVSSITLHLLIDPAEVLEYTEEDGHQWLHQELDLTPEEIKAIDSFEPEYQQERAALQDQFQAKIEELRQVIIRSDTFSEEVKATIHELHIIHGQLQELSIQHYYQMMHILPADKQARLQAIAAKALSVPQS